MSLVVTSQRRPRRLPFPSRYVDRVPIGRVDGSVGCVK